jgi:hypothetical protein
VPRYRELKLKNVLKQVLPNAKLESYLPNKRSNKYLINQDFVLRLVAKLEPEYFDKLTASSFDARQKPLEQDGKKEQIALSKEVYEALMKEPFKSSKSSFLFDVC